MVRAERIACRGQHLLTKPFILLNEYESLFTTFARDGVNRSDKAPDAQLVRPPAAA